MLRIAVQSKGRLYDETMNVAVEEARLIKHKQANASCYYRQKVFR